MTQGKTRVIIEGAVEGGNKKPSLGIRSIKLWKPLQQRQLGGIFLAPWKHTTSSDSTREQGENSFHEFVPFILRKNLPFFFQLGAFGLRKALWMEHTFSHLFALLVALQAPTQKQLLRVSVEKEAAMGTVSTWTSLPLHPWRHLQNPIHDLDRSSQDQVLSFGFSHEG